jgi:hypothetical protein
MEELMARRLREIDVAGDDKVTWMCPSAPGGAREWQNLTSAHSLSWLRPHANCFFANKRRAGRKWAAAAARQRPLLPPESESHAADWEWGFAWGSLSHDKAIWSFSLTLFSSERRKEEPRSPARLGSAPSRRTRCCWPKNEITHRHTHTHTPSFDIYHSRAHASRPLLLGESLRPAFLISSLVPLNYICAPATLACDLGTSCLWLVVRVCNSTSHAHPLKMGGTIVLGLASSKFIISDVTKTNIIL